MLKEEEQLEVWTSAKNGTPIKLDQFKVLGKSGVLGPKRREGDKQIPEGLYRIPGLNPNSSFHLSIKVDYPNQWDTEHATEEDRQNIGSNIFIHGSNASIGCVAIGDPAIEKLFALVAETGKSNVDVIIAPFDLRDDYDAKRLPKDEEWYAELYDTIEEAMQPYQE